MREQQGAIAAPYVPTLPPSHASHCPRRRPQSKLALEWRQWMTERLLAEYLSERTFYGLQQSAEVDNPDQRITSDVA